MDGTKSSQTIFVVTRVILKDNWQLVSNEQKKEEGEKKEDKH